MTENAMGSVRSWLSRRPFLVDGAVALAVFLFSVQIDVGVVWQGFATLVGIALSLGLSIPWVFRRQAPVVSFFAILMVSCVQWLFEYELVPANVLLLAGLYNVASKRSWHWSLVAAGFLEMGVVLTVLRNGEEMFQSVINVGYMTLWIVVVWLLGYTIGTRRAYVESLRERAHQLEQERDSQALIAAAAERARIAREIHDIVSHSLSAVVVLADGAAVTLRSDPDRTEKALADISRRGRSAMNEMQRMLGVLRDDRPESNTPQPGIAQLEQLVADAYGTGLPVRLATQGFPQTLPAGLQLVVYRIVQEALTNVRKHAWPEVSRVDVTVCYGEDMIEVHVVDDGRGCSPQASAPLGGRGLVGMRERVTAYGGSLRIGVRSGGGFEVVAALPIEPERPEADKR